jgi:ankyrin repeat protein
MQKNVHEEFIESIKQFPNMLNQKLLDAASEGNFELAKLCLENGADPNCKSGNENTPLHKACREGHLKLLKLLCKYKANVNIKNILDDRPLHLACKNGHFACVKYLVEHTDADINVYGFDYLTPLDVAKESNNSVKKKIVNYLKTQKYKKLDDIDDINYDENIQIKYEYPHKLHAALQYLRDLKWSENDKEKCKN